MTFCNITFHNICVTHIGNLDFDDIRTAIFFYVSQGSYSYLDLFTKITFTIIRTFKN